MTLWVNNCQFIMEIRLLTKDELLSNLELFCNLYNSCFNDTINDLIVNQRYIQNPENELWMCVAIDENRIVANYSVSPSIICIEGKRLKCALSLNTMTHPDYVGKGLFVQLARLLYEKLKESGYCMVYGFPNYISNRTFCTKLGWQDIYEVPTMELCLDKPIVWTPSKVILDVDWIEEKPIAGKICIEKSANYLIWRYKNKPNVSYHKIRTINGGWAVYKFFQDMTNIVEFHPSLESDYYDILGYIECESKKNGKTKMTLWSDMNSEEHLLLEKFGFRNRYPITYFGACDLNMPCGIDIFNYRNWKINMGDDNVY